MIAWIQLILKLIFFFLLFVHKKFRTGSRPYITEKYFRIIYFRLWSGLVEMLWAFWVLKANLHWYWMEWKLNWHYYEDAIHCFGASVCRVYSKPLYQILEVKILRSNVPIYWNLTVICSKHCLSSIPNLRWGFIHKK